MKMIMIYIRPEQLPDIKDALFDAQIRHFTATTVMGTAPNKEQQMYRGVKREVSLFKRLKIEVMVQEASVDTAIDAISRGAMESGGYGKIFVSNIEEVVKIWTGERGNQAM